MEREKKDYEIAFLAKDEQGAQGVFNALKARGAEITLEGPVEKITLSYKVKGEASAHFGYVHFRALPEDAVGISKDMKIQPLLLRSLIITPPFEKPKPRWEGRVRPKTAVSAPISSVPAIEREKPAQLPLSNEALEKKIEEILK